MNQPGLFDALYSPPAVAHSVTSRQAAEQIKPSVSALRAKVLACLKAHPERSGR